MSSDNDIWITGIGAASPLGSGIEQITDAVLQGKTSIQPIDHFDTTTHASKIASHLSTIPDCPWPSDPTVPPTGRLIESCSWQALKNADWKPSNGKLGLALGLGPDWMLSWEATWHPPAGGTLERNGQPYPAYTDLIMRHWKGSIGPTTQVSSACASGNHALVLGASMLLGGAADAVLAGAAAVNTTPLTMSVFGNLRATSRRNDDPARACRPFDRDRDGFVMGDGGAIFVLEKAGKAKARGAKPLALLAGWGMTSDAHHLVMPSTDQTHVIMAMRQAIERAAIAPGELGYINAHAPGTPAGDAMEAQAIRTLAEETEINAPVSSTKGATGHLLAAAASLELAMGVICMQRQLVPATLNLETIDPSCEGIEHILGHARPSPLRWVLSNAFGFGGSNCSVAIRSAT
ncbi:MAG: beta-ketoacyl-[acyl-carrier-protein] synthase family protein [Planctomycetota bacterium]